MRLPAVREASEKSDRGRWSLSARDRQHLLELVNRRKSAGSSGGSAKWRAAELSSGEGTPGSAKASPRGPRSNGSASGGSTPTPRPAPAVDPECVTRLPRGGLHVQTKHAALRPQPAAQPHTHTHIHTYSHTQQQQRNHSARGMHSNTPVVQNNMHYTQK